jgi:spermidine synthase
MPASLTRPLADPRVTVHHGDGRAFIRKARSRYDVILLSLPDPTTAAINRFYSEDFFREAKRALAPGGLLCLGLSGSEIHLSGFVLLSAAALDQTLARVFPDRLLVPGDRMLFLASAQPGRLTSDWQLLSGRLFSRGMQTQFVNDVWLRDSLFPFRGDLLRQQLAQVPNPRTNTDLNPVSYYYQTGIWLDRLSSSLAAPVRFLSHVSLWWGLPLIPLALLIAILGRGARAADAAVLTAAACTGGFGLVVELLCLLVFQSACGYLYHAIGILIAAFMAGLALGAAALRGRQADATLRSSETSLRSTSAQRLGKLLLAGLATAALASLALPRLLGFALQASGLAPFLLGLLLLLSGSLVGAFFPIAAALYLRSRQAASAAGAVYAADVLGSAGAGLLAGAFVIPLLGVTGTCYGLALILAAAAVLAAPLAIRR